MNASKQVSLILFLAAVLIGSASAQPGRGMPQGTIAGIVHDSDLDVPVEYANVVLYLLRDSSQVTGTVTSETGAFELKGVRPGAYYLEVSFIGYHSRSVDNIRLAPNARLDLDPVPLKQAVLPMEGAEAVGERPTLTYEIDKKVIDVAKLPSARTGTAVDALENVPSVTVDVEGNVSLRGSQSFTVLIDGRPTMLEPSEALQQIPAATIKNIEIITNPSAKYDPDGVAGIINVILKKQKVLGVSGLLNARAGSGRKYGGDGLLGYKRGIANLHLGGYYGDRSSGGIRDLENQTTRGSTTSYVNSSGTTDWSVKYYGLRGGAELQLGPNDQVGLAGRLGVWDVNSMTDFSFDEWSEPGTVHRRYDSDGDAARRGTYYYVTGDHQHDFGGDGHKIQTRVTWSRSDGETESAAELRDSARTLTNGWTSSEQGPGRRLRLKVDYTLPLREKDKLEAGYQSRFEGSSAIDSVHEYNPAGDSYEFNPDFSHEVQGGRNIHSLYALYAGNWKQFGYQGGLRGEYGDRSIGLLDQDTTYVLTRWDYFPTIHLSYDLPAEQQVMVSYTRRIERPHRWMLDPSVTWQDAYTVQQGNPELRPEYIDSYEVSHQVPFGANRLSTEAFYRRTTDLHQWVSLPYGEGENVFLQTAENVGIDRALGVEFMAFLNLFKWWDVTLSGDVYDYRVQGTLHGDTFSRRSLSWSTRLNTTFKFPTKTRLRLSGHYSGPSATAQGRREGNFTADVSASQSFLNRRLSLSLQVRDVLKTGEYESFSEGEGFSTRAHFIHEAPVLSLSVKYNFNNFKLDQRMQDPEGAQMEGGQGM